MKKLSFIFAMMLATGFAMAQINANVMQSGVSGNWDSGYLVNTAGVQQVGTNVTLDVDQTATTLWNIVTSGQGGTNMHVKLDATAGTSNWAHFEQGGGSDFDINVKQIAGTSNYASVRQPGGLNNDIDVVQDAGTFNSLQQVQYGKNDIVNLKQTSKLSNTANTDQGNWGVNEPNNVLYGAIHGTWGPEYASTAPAEQTSSNSYNDLKLVQKGSDNKVGLYQNGYDYNFADITQTEGQNSLLIYQTNIDGFNSVTSHQTGGQNSASVLQTTLSGNGTIIIDQH